jgi:hypothetical protein
MRIFIIDVYHTMNDKNDQDFCTIHGQDLLCDE